MNRLISGQNKNPINFIPIRRPNPEVEDGLRLAWKHFGQERDFNKVKEIVQNVIITDPENDDAYLLLGCVYEDSGEFKFAEENLKKAIEINPYNMEAHRQLFRLYRNFDKNELAKKELEVMLKISPEDEELKKFKKFGIPCSGDEDLIFTQLKYNLMQIINLLKSKKIILILQTYPHPYPSYITRIKDISREHNIPLVDNETTFRGLNYKDYSVSDTHPNERGYFIMAKSVLEEIEKINVKSKP